MPTLGTRSALEATKDPIGGPGVPVAESASIDITWHDPLSEFALPPIQVAELRTE